MRLTSFERENIKKTFYKLFENGKVYLFGSRVDDLKRGGDIDLYIELESQLPIKEEMHLKSKFRLALYELIGEQKIDVVIAKDKNRAIEQEILNTRILL